jgi:hypothetical protein
MNLRFKKTLGANFLMNELILSELNLGRSMGGIYLVIELSRS